MERLIGARISRVEDPRILCGRGRYIADLVLPRMLHASFCRSPLPHARVRRIDTSAALALPGVVAVYTAADFADVCNPIQLPGGPDGLARPAHTALASDKVRFAGDPVAVVVADSRAVAEDACDLVEVEYDRLPAIATIEQALDAESARVWDALDGNVAYRRHDVYGDPDAGFARAAHVLHERFVQYRQANVPMETRGAVADFDPGSGDLTYHLASQGVHPIRWTLGVIFRMPTSRIVVRQGDVGGSFGQKAYVRPEDVAIVAASKLLGRPVKWIEDRTENLMTAGHARSEELDVEIAFDDDGVVRGLRVAMVLDQGAYPLSNVPVTSFIDVIRMMLPSAYRIRDYEFDTTVVFSNKASYVAYRAPFEAETWVRERMFDRIARELDLDAIEVRRRNLIADDDQPYAMVTGPTLSGITVRAALDESERVAGYPAFREEQARARDEGRYLGVGVAVFVESAPGPGNLGESLGFVIPPERAVARLEIDGTLSVYTSQAPHGQGHETTLAQVAAETLGVPMASVRVVHGDSRTSPFSLIGTAGSRSATMATGAVLGATRDVRAQIARIAAHCFEASADDIEVVDGVAQVRGTPAVAMPLAQVGMMANVVPHLLPPGAPPGIEATFDFQPGDGGWTQAVHTCFVDVSIETGLVKILRYIAVEDCGDVINPAIVDGQIRGGITQGLAGVLYEHADYDVDGNFRASTFMDYLVPTALEIPEIEIHHVPTVRTQEVNFRGVGEGGALGAPAALTSAIEDALSPFGATITHQYLPPTRILELAGVI